jgi:hypothetical protein
MMKGKDRANNRGFKLLNGNGASFPLFSLLGAITTIMGSECNNSSQLESEFLTSLRCCRLLTCPFPGIADTGSMHEKRL